MAFQGMTSNEFAPALAKPALGVLELAALAGAMALAGCGNWSDEDAEFLAAMPQKQDLTLSTLSDTSSQTSELTAGNGARASALSDRSSVYDLVSGGVGRINAFVEWFTGGLDAVRSWPPSIRETGKRIWGPFPDKAHPGFDIQIIMLRETTGYRYELQWKRHSETDFTAVVVGHFYGERARGGSGDLLLDFDQGRAVGIAGALEANRAVSLSYDLSRSRPNELIARKENGDSASWKYLVFPEGGGDVQFQVQTNFYGLPTSANETLHIHARWNVDRAGRADVTLSGSDLPAGGQYAECWAADQLKVYWAKNFDCGPLRSCSDGDPAGCALGALE